MFLDDGFQVSLECGHHYQRNRAGTSDPEAAILVRARDVAKILVFAADVAACPGLTTNYCCSATDRNEKTPMHQIPKRTSRVEIRLSRSERDILRDGCFVVTYHGFLR
jgi:hypothetical protein